METGGEVWGEIVSWLCLAANFATASDSDAEQMLTTSGTGSERQVTEDYLTASVAQCVAQRALGLFLKSDLCSGQLIAFRGGAF